MYNLKYDFMDLTEEETKAMDVANEEFMAMPLDPDFNFPDGDLTLDLLSLDLELIPGPPAPTGPPVAPTVPPAGPSRRISIRIPHDVIDAIKREARRTGVKYQTLMKEKLRTLSAAW